MSLLQPPRANPAAARDLRVLDSLRAEMARVVGGPREATDVLPFGVATIDEHLPGGGLSRCSLHEVSGGADDIVHGAAAALFIAGVLARLGGSVLWCLRQRDLFAPGLAGVGLHPDRVIYVEAGNARTVLLVMEEALKHGGLAGVVGEIDKVGMTPSRRLQLAAETARIPAFLLRRWRRVDDAARADGTAAVTRWRVRAAPSPNPAKIGIGRANWHLELLRCRNGEAASWNVEACDGQGYLAPGDRTLPAYVADRSPASDRQRRAVA